MQDAASPLAQRVTELTTSLGLTHKEIGQVVQASGRSVSRWASGEVAPQPLNKQRLVELAYVAHAVLQAMPREEANLWMHTPHQVLGHETPAARIRTGGYMDVIAVIESLADVAN